MRNRSVPQPHAMAGHREVHLGCRGPPGEARGASPTLGLPSPEFQCQEEASPQKLAAKIRGDSGRLGETEGAGTADAPAPGTRPGLGKCQRRAGET